MIETTFESLEATRQKMEEFLQSTLSPQQTQALANVRAMEAKKLEQDRAKADEGIAQRVAEILAGKMSGPRVHGTTINEPARIVGHKRLRCKACGLERPADHQSDSKNPSAGGCGGDIRLSHDFHGIDTVIESVDSLQPHHAIYIDGTVAYPARA